MNCAVTGCCNSRWCKLIEIVGEAASRVPDEFRKANPAVPWQLAADMRNKLIHGYDVVEFAIVYDTVKADLPLLVQQLETLLPDIESG